MADTRHAYARDIQKLSKLDSDKYVKIFCALVDAWETDGKADERITYIEEKFPDEFDGCGDFEVLKTKNDRYKGPTCCVICVWKVK